MNSTLAVLPDFLIDARDFADSSRARKSTMRKASVRQTTLSADFTHPIELANEPRWQKLLAANGARLSALKPGWDGPGSLQVNAGLLFAAVDMVQRALRHMPHANGPYLVPGGDGGIQIEWHELHAELELELAPDGSSHIVLHDHLTGAERVEEGSEAINLFFHWAPWVASQPDDDDHVPSAPDVANFSFAA